MNDERVMQPMRAILFDVEGVLYEGDHPLPGAVETLAWCEAQQIPHLFITNTTSITRAAFASRLQRMGLPIAPERLITPATAAAHWLRDKGPVALFVAESAREEFAQLPQSESAPRAVVIGDLGEQWSYEKLNGAFRLLMSEPTPQLVALGATRYWRAADGLRLDVGPFVAALENASGVKAMVLGKPAPNYYRVALERLGAPAGETVMIGDDIQNDICGAQASGMKAVLVRTGKFAPRDLQAGIKPDAVLDSIADLQKWW